MIRRYCILKIILGLLPLTALAQPSLIIRLQDQAPPTLLAALEDGAGKQGAYGALFDGVEAVQAVLPRGGPGKRQGAPFLAFSLTKKR